MTLNSPTVPGGPTEARSHVVDRCRTDLGELVLRRCGDDFELISNGMFLMDTRDGWSERALIDEVLAVAPPQSRVVIGGLGFGFSLEAAVASEIPDEIVVVEIHRKVIEWNRTHLPERTAKAMADPRVKIVCADIGEWLDRDEGPLDALCLDTDNGPDWLTLPENESIYDEERLARLGERLGDRGVVAFWSANRSPAFEESLRCGFAEVAIHEVPVVRGEPDVVYVARRRVGATSQDERAARGS